MRAPLKTNQRIFVEKMKADAENAKWGFERLLEVPDFANYFEPLAKAGLFAPANNPAPTVTPDGKYWSIPHWPALGYLEKCAKWATEQGDMDLANGVALVLKNVSRAVRDGGGQPDNYRTFFKFAETMGLLPLSIVDEELISLVPVWLSSRFDRGLVASVLDSGYLPRALSSDNPRDWQKACSVLAHCTAIRSDENDRENESAEALTTVVDDFWLKEMLDHHAASFGKRVGAQAAELMLQRTRRVFAAESKLTVLFRPAIEKHEQNHDWRNVQNSFVEASRDILLAWIEQDPTTAGPYVGRLIEHEDAEIVRRIAIFVANEKWLHMQSHFLPLIAPNLFQSGHLHELYHLLKARFSLFGTADKENTVKAIQGIRLAKEDRTSLRRMQRLWLSAVAGQGYAPVEEWYAELNDDQQIGELSDHPDFFAYSETHWGHGPAPFEAAELVAFALDGSLVTRLNNFRETDGWRGPSVRSLSDALGEAVALSPEAFVKSMQELLTAKRPYQFGVVDGFKRLWTSDEQSEKRVEWGKAWPVLITFFESLLADESFWGPEEQLSREDMTPRRDWLIALIADFLAAGTKRDEKAFAPSLLPRTRQLIQILLRRVRPTQVPDDDPMSRAINSNRGKVVEALVNQALRECRLADKEVGSHLEVWGLFVDSFDAELAKCRDGNFEFSTLAGSFFANLEYLGADWVSANVERIFPREYEDNFACALGGLAYAPATRSSYALLNSKGLIEHALGLTAKGRQTREKLIERVALAYLWGDETLDSPRLAPLFTNGAFDDLQEIAEFCWRVKNQGLEDIQEERVRSFLQKCLTIGLDEHSPPPAVFLSHLGRLLIYVRTLGDEEARWLVKLAPYVGRDFFAFEFVEQLHRLLPQNPRVVADALQAMASATRQYTDYKGRMKALLLDLAESGQRAIAIRVADHLREMPGMAETYDQLSV